MVSIRVLCIFAALAGLAAAATLRAAGPSPKAYVVGEIDVHDPEGYKAYAARAPAILAKYGGSYLARGGQTVPMEGAGPSGRVVIVEFPDVATARAFLQSEEYGAVAAIRRKASTGRFFIVEALPN